MHIPGPYSDDTWNWPSDVWKEERMRKNSNRPLRVMWEMGIVLAVPLTGAALVELVLRAFGVH